MEGKTERLVPSRHTSEKRKKSNAFCFSSVTLKRGTPASKRTQRESRTWREPRTSQTKWGEGKKEGGEKEGERERESFFFLLLLSLFEFCAKGRGEKPASNSEFSFFPPLFQSRRVACRRLSSRRKQCEPPPATARSPPSRPLSRAARGEGRGTRQSSPGRCEPHRRCRRQPSPPSAALTSTSSVPLSLLPLSPLAPPRASARGCQARGGGDSSTL